MRKILLPLFKDRKIITALEGWVFNIALFFVVWMHAIKTV